MRVRSLAGRADMVCAPLGSKSHRSGRSTVRTQVMRLRCGSRRHIISKHIDSDISEDSLIENGKSDFPVFQIF